MELTSLALCPDLLTPPTLRSDAWWILVMMLVAAYSTSTPPLVPNNERPGLPFLIVRVVRYGCLWYIDYLVRYAWG